MRFRKSKWKQANLLNQNPVTRTCVPETARYSEEVLKDFLTRYSSVYIKPDGGGRGRGIYRILAGEKAFQVQSAERCKTFQDLADVHRAIESVVGYRSHIIQRGIDSKTSDGRPFDIRVHVQRLNGEWIVGGIVGKVGAPSEIVTNRHRGGRPVSIQVLLRRHLGLDRKRGEDIKRRLKHLSIETAEAMTKGYPGWLEYVIDIGVDPAGSLWIYEANITPGIAVFAALPNRQDYRRILKYRRLRRQKSS